MVIDTTILIDHLRKKNKANSHFSLLPGDIPLFISSMTIFELMIGASDSGKVKDIERVLRSVSIIDIDAKISLKASEVFFSLKKRNLLIEFRDIFIAATALTHNLPIKTLNIKHFSRIDGLELL